MLFLHSINKATLKEQIKAKDQTIKQAKELIDKLPTTKFYQSDQDGCVLVHTSACKAFRDQELSDSEVDWEVDQQLIGYDYDAHFLDEDEECNQCGTFQCPLVGKDYKDTKYSKILKDETASLEAKNAAVMEAYRDCKLRYGDGGIILKEGCLEDFYPGINIEITKFVVTIKPGPNCEVKVPSRKKGLLSTFNDLLYENKYLKYKLEQKVYYIHYLMDEYKKFDARIKQKFYAFNWFINDYFNIETWLDEFKYLPGWRHSYKFISKLNPVRCIERSPGIEIKWRIEKSMSSLLKYCQHVGKWGWDRVLNSEEIWIAVKKFYEANKEYMVHNLAFKLWVLAKIRKYLSKSKKSKFDYEKCTDMGLNLYQRIRSLFCTPVSVQTTKLLHWTTNIQQNNR